MTYWQKLPVWFRKVFMASLETSILAFLVYFGNVLDGTQSWSVNVAILAVLKAVMQTLRVHPGIPLKDYINSQK